MNAPAKVSVLLHLYDVLGNLLSTLAIEDGSLLSATNRAVAFGYAQRNAETGPRVHAFTVTDAMPLAQMQRALWTCYDVRDRRVSFQAGPGDAAKWFVRSSDGTVRPVPAIVSDRVREYEQELAEINAALRESLDNFFETKR